MKEIRYLAGISLRSTSKRTIAGYAAVFNEPAQIGSFTEVIRAGAFSRALRERQDVRLLFNHDSNKVLGRSRSGTLVLSEDGTGLHFECKLSDSPTANDVLMMIERGDVDQCSFTFEPKEDRWSEHGRKRELLDVNLFDVSPVTFPAYQGTSVSARSAEDEVGNVGTYAFSRGSGIYLPREETPEQREMETERRRRKAEVLHMKIRLGK